MIHIISKGNVDGITATAIYIRMTKFLIKEKYNPIFAESFELKTIIRKIKINLEDTLIFINIDINLSLIRDIKCNHITIYIDKPIPIEFSIDELLSPCNIISNYETSTSIIVFNHLKSLIEKKTRYISSYHYEWYLATLGALADKVFLFERYHQYISQVKFFSKSLILDPYDNEFRMFILNKLVSGVYIKDIPEIRERALEVKALTEEIINLASLHKIYNDNKFSIYYYKETDIVQYAKKEYTMKGRFSHVTTRLAIMNKTINILLVEKETKRGCYIILRKNNIFDIDLLYIADIITKYIEKHREKNYSIYYNGNSNAVSINMDGIVIKNSEIIEIVKYLESTLTL